MGRDWHLQTITKDKRSGFLQSQPPMSFLSKDGNPTVYYIDPCNMLVAVVRLSFGQILQLNIFLLWQKTVLLN